MSHNPAFHPIVKMVVRQLRPDNMDATLPAAALRRWANIIEAPPVETRQQFGRDFIVVALRFGKNRARLAATCLTFLAAVAVGPRRTGDLVEKGPQHGQSPSTAPLLSARSATLTAALAPKRTVGICLAKRPPLRLLS
jgi:hypothetical protein